MRLSPRLHRSFIETRPKSASREPNIISLITGRHLARILLACTGYHVTVPAPENFCYYHITHIHQSI